MINLFYPKLALDNIKKNKKIYFPYILTCIFNILMFYMLASLSNNQGINELPGGDSVLMVLGLGQFVVGFFSIIFLFYTNSFLMKRRKKEFGLFNVLGMGKNHLARIVFLETIFIFIFSIGTGLALGIALDKLAFLSLLRLFTKDIPLGFHISFTAIKSSLSLFGIIFFLILIHSLFQIYSSKPIELLKSESAGEKEPKGNWFLALLGVICLGAGYYFSVTTKNPVAAINVFFIAVILVILGTYLIFTSTSIVVLKALRKNKNYYYKTKHFISVSNMLYRMKQNAVGIANICILSTMVLVMISTTSSLWIGTTDLIDSRIPRDFEMITKEPESVDSIKDSIENISNEYNTTIENLLYYERIIFTVYREKNILTIPDPSKATLGDFNKIESVLLITLDQYNKMNNTSLQLEDNEIFLYTNKGKFSYDTLSLGSYDFKVKEKLKEFKGGEGLSANINSTQFLVVKDKTIFNDLANQQKEVYQENASTVEYYFGFNYENVSDDVQKEMYMDLRTLLNSQDISFVLESRSIVSEGMFSIYAGFFFIGIFLSIIFIIATILIMYYKQISEGYEDKARFEIMQKVGLSKKEIKQSIQSQVLIIFFMPLVTAGIHVAFAFPVINRLMNMLYFDNIPLFIKVTITCFIIFSILYAIVYKLTAKTYYKIVE